MRDIYCLDLHGAFLRLKFVLPLFNSMRDCSMKKGMNHVVLKGYIR